MDRVDRAARRPHGERVPVINCGECHEDVSKIYTKHGQMEVGKDSDIPKCWSCHGSHDILPSSNRDSHVPPLNLAATCESCHTNVDIIKNHDLLKEEPIKLYESSVHGRATQRGLHMAATCSECHPANAPNSSRTAHRILGGGDGNPRCTISTFRRHAASVIGESRKTIGKASTDS